MFQADFDELNIVLLAFIGGFKNGRKEKGGF